MLQELFRDYKHEWLGGKVPTATMLSLRTFARRFVGDPDGHAALIDLALGHCQGYSLEGFFSPHLFYDDHSNSVR